MFCGAVFDLAGAVDDGLADGVEDLEGAVVGFLGASFCLLGVGFKVIFFFLGGSLGIFFFSSAIALFQR